MLFAVADDSGLFIAHIGDGAIVLQDEVGGPWECISWPTTGEYASTTYFVTDDAGVRLHTRAYERAPRALAMFSDGIERLVLDFKELKAPPSFFDTMAKSMHGAVASGVQRDLSKQLGSYLDSSKINERTDDDKTLIVAIRS
jgi:hypothetical protein